MKSILIAVAIGFLAIGGCSGNAKPTPKESSPPKAERAVKASVSKPQGAITEDELGIPFYPGSKLISGAAKGRTMSAMLATTDPPEKVAAFYERILGAKAVKIGNMISVQGSAGHANFAVVPTLANGTTTISVMGERQLPVGTPQR